MRASVAVIPSSPPGPGTVIASKYRLERELGRGGMGAVHEATHLLTGQRVALKQLLAPLATDAAAVTRLLREARIAAQLTHPGIVRIYDVEQHEGSVLLVMELLSGESLAARLARGPMSPADAVALLGPVMRALAFAHAHGVVHRDVKPENVFLHRAGDGQLVPKILDFGIAKMPESLAGTAHLTDTRAVMGSPYYMSPEQLRGAKHVDARTDVYSMGVVLFQALTGQVPHRADTFGELVYLVTTTAPPMLRTLRPDLSQALEAVVARALAKEPAQRFSDMASLAVAFEDAASRPFLAPTVLGTPPPPPALGPSPTVSSARPIASPAPPPAPSGSTTGIAVLVGCVAVALAGIPCAAGAVFVALGLAASSGGASGVGLGGGDWMSPACLVDVNGDDALDVAGLVGSFESRRLTVIDGRDGSTLWEPVGTFAQGDELFCPRAPALGVTGWVAVARIDFTLDLYSTSAHERPITVRTPDRAAAYGVGRGCIAVRSTDDAITGIALPSGQLARCETTADRGILPMGETPGIGTPFPMDAPYAVTSGDVVYELSLRSPGTPFLIASAKRRGVTSWTTQLGVRGVGAGRARVMAPTPNTLVVVGSSTAGQNELSLIGLDVRTGAIRYQVPYPGHTFAILSIEHAGRYVIATAPWAGLVAIDPDTATVAFSR